MNWQQVHLRLLSTLPVRTHRRREAPPPPPPRPRSSAATLALRSAIQKRDRQGKSIKDIADELEVTVTTVRNHLKAIASEAADHG
jgi:DNA-binding NarL/FixJ family response regulator